MSGLSALVPLSITAQLLLFYIVLRHMKRTMLILTATVLLVATPTADAADAAHRVYKKLECRLPEHAHILAANRQALVYETSESNTRLPTVYGCAYGHRGAYLLGEPVPSVATSEGIGGIRLETLSGAMVAYQYAVAGREQSARWTIFVQSLSNGRVIHRLPTGVATHPEPEFGGIGPTAAIAVKSSGAVAWIVESHYEPASPKNDYVGSSEYTVEAADSTGNRLLASGQGIDPSSLALAGSTLYWTQGGKPASAVLN
jgi:hypothetical protein